MSVPPYSTAISPHRKGSGEIARVLSARIDVLFAGRNKSCKECRVDLLPLLPLRLPGPVLIGRRRGRAKGVRQVVDTRLYRERGPSGKQCKTLLKRCCT